MKKPKSEFATQRSRCLIQNFRAYLATQSQITAKKAFQAAADAPAPRFWIGEARATRIISLMLKGEDILDGMKTDKREMYREIYSRVMLLRKKNPGAPLGDLVFEVVNGPAPKSYMSWDRAYRLIRNR